MYVVLLVVVLISGVVQSQQTNLTETQKQQIVDKHNEVRTAVVPCAADMPKLIYTTEFEEEAQRFVETCNQTFKDGKLPLDFNFGFYTPATDPPEPLRIVEDWVHQSCYYTYCSNSCIIGKLCDRYTAMIRSINSIVSCAINRCPNFDQGQEAITMACRYSLSENPPKERPYIEGEPCTLCLPTSNQCEANLCVADTPPPS